MDIFKSCSEAIQKRLDELEKYIEVQKNNDGGEGEYQQTQTIIEAVMADTDKDLNRILDQQAHVKMIIERDCRIKSLKKAIAENTRAMEVIRKCCATIGLNANKDRQQLLEDQSKELEKFQMQQLKSITEDHRRHQDILEQRKKEILGLKKETENEENNRESYLANVEKNLEKDLRNRQQLRLGNNIEGCSSGGAITDEVRDPDHCELTSVDEYSLYDGAPHSRGGTNSKQGATRGKKKDQRKKEGTHSRL